MTNIRCRRLNQARFTRQQLLHHGLFDLASFTEALFQYLNLVVHIQEMWWRWWFVLLLVETTFSYQYIISRRTKLTDDFAIMDTMQS
jgi:hypothetical protein